MNDNEMFDPFPSMANSNEVYFGRESNLAQMLLKLSKDLKTLIPEDMVDYSDKKFITKLYRVVDNFNNSLKVEMNCEKVQLCIVPDETNNACAYLMSYKGDFITYKQNKKYLDFDKIADYEDIVIDSKGYHYRYNKGKIIIIALNTGCIKKLSEEQIAATLCHEIGHCVQEGIFGVYKEYADQYFAQEAFRSLCFWQPITVKYGFLNIINLLWFVFFPFALTLGAINLIRNLIVKNKFKKQQENPTFRMKDELNRMDNENSQTLFKDIDTQILNKAILDNASDDSSERDALATDLLEENKTKMENTAGTQPKQEKKSNPILNFFRSIAMDLAMVQNKIFRFLTCSTFVSNNINKITMTKKYEFFADIFATSHGFGPDLYKDLTKEEKDMTDSFYKDDIVGINNISLLKAAVMCSRYKELRQLRDIDVHGTSAQRGSAMLTSLYRELQINKSLTSDQKKSIMKDIEELEKANQIFNEDKKQGGFWFKFYDKLVQERINGHDIQVEENILKSIETVCKECSSKNKK